MDATVCYVGGFGRLGFPMAVWTAHCGYLTAIADIDGDAVRSFIRGIYSSPEPRVDELSAEAKNLFATTNVEAAARGADLIFVITQTPGVDDGSFTAGHVVEACRAVGKGIRDSDRRPVVCIASTVMPGTVEGEIRDALELASGKTAHKDFGLCCTPEFVRQGAIVEDFSEPDFVVVGCKTDWEWEAVRSYYYGITVNDPPVIRMSVPSAEIAKMALNVAVVAKVARANEIALLCHFTPGADAEDVLDVVGRDGRIGGKYFSAGPPPGGPCFPRDSSAMQVAMHRVGIHPHVTAGVHDFDRYLVKRLAWIVADLLDAAGEKTVGILGLTYKPGVPLTVGSPGLWLAEELKRFPPIPEVYGYDPMLRELEVEEPIRDLCVAIPLEHLVDVSDVLVLATPCEEFLSLYDMNLMDKDVVDLWGFLPHLECRKYVRFGKGA